jgi:hypothetical protein
MAARGLVPPRDFDVFVCGPHHSDQSKLLAFRDKKTASEFLDRWIQSYGPDQAELMARRLGYPKHGEVFPYSLRVDQLAIARIGEAVRTGEFAEWLHSSGLQAGTDWERYEDLYTSEKLRPVAIYGFRESAHAVHFKLRWL